MATSRETRRGPEAVAGYSATVCLPAAAAADVRAALTEALAPFGETTELEWDQGFLWDTWRIAGAADGYGFWVAEGFEEDGRLIFDDARWDGPADLRRPGVCAGGPRALLDFGASPVVGRRIAMQAWELWQSLAREHPPARPVREFVARHQKTPHHWFDHELVVSEFEAQPLVRAFLAAQPLGGRDPERFSSASPVSPGTLIDFTGDGESFADAVVRHGFGGADLLTLDGWWIEWCGARANHGACGSACEHSFTDIDLSQDGSGFGRAHLRYLEALPPDALIVRVRGHC